MILVAEERVRTASEAVEALLSERGRQAKRGQSYERSLAESNKLLNFNFHVSPWRTQTDATDAMARTLEVVKSFTLKSHQSNKCYEGREGEE